MKDYEQLLFPRVLTMSDEEVDHKLWSRMAQLKAERKSESVIQDSVLQGLRVSQWLGHYRGVIPASWDDSHEMVAHIKMLSQMDFKLNDGLTKAVLTHPRTFAVLELASVQLLTADQLAIVVARHDLPHYVKDTVSTKQRLLGADHSVWRRAGRIAKEQGQALIPHLSYRSILNS